MAKNTPETAAPEAAPAEGAPATEAAPKRSLAKQNGVSKPEGAKTGAVWDLSDRISREKGRPALREEVMAAGLAMGLNKGTIATQYARWTTFYGVSTADRKAVRAQAAGATAEPAAAAPAGATA